MLARRRPAAPGVKRTRKVDAASRLPARTRAGRRVTRKSPAWSPEIATLGLPASVRFRLPEFRMTNSRTIDPSVTLTEPKLVPSIGAGVESPLTMGTPLRPSTPISGPAPGLTTST